MYSIETQSWSSFMYVPLCSTTFGWRHNFIIMISFLILLNFSCPLKEIILIACYSPPRALPLIREGKKIEKKKRTISFVLFKVPLKTSPEDLWGGKINKNSSKIGKLKKQTLLQFSLNWNKYWKGLRLRSSLFFKKGSQK